MFNSKQVVQHSLFGSNGFKNTLSCEFEDFPEEIFEVGNKENSVIDNLESETENLRQENFDLKKNLELHKHYKKTVEEYYEEVSKLTIKEQTLAGKVKGLEAELQRKTKKLIENNQDIEQLKQEVEILLLETQNKSDVIKNLNDQLKNAKNEVQLTDKINEELQQKLNLAEAELSKVRKESTALINSIENLKSDYENQILEKEKEFNDVRDQFSVHLSEHEELFVELNRLQKENESLKQKNFYVSNEVSLADEVNEENVRKEIARLQPEVEIMDINDDQESTWLYGKTEDYRISEDKNLENTDFEIGVWNETDSESNDDDNVIPCPDYDESFGRRYSQLFYDETIIHNEKDTFVLIRQKDSFSLAKLKLNTREEEKYENIWQKINKIHDYLDILGYSGSEEDYDKCEKELDKVISEALKQEIMFTFPYKSNMSLIDRIADIFPKLYLSADTTRIHEFLHRKKIFQIISEGTSLNGFSEEEHADFVNVICSDRDTLSKRYANLSKLKELVFESVINKSEQVDEHDFELEIDNGYFCIDYPHNSIIEVARILNNQKAKDLNLNIGVLQIGKSVIRVENIGGRRNYTDISVDSIEISFTTEVGEICIHLCPSEKDSNKIEVRLVDEVRFNKLENKSSLGLNCLLGGKSVLTAIENGYFKRNSSVFEELDKAIKQSDCTIENPSSFLEGVNRNQLLKIKARAHG
uniref:Chromosome partition protein Smc n=1 Tax=Wolbachia endosymbiont of Aleurodicus dispersus TaxID=1288877 RepID=A0A3B0IWF4_9RICK